jgi:hypothetical protein
MLIGILFFGMMAVFQTQAMAGYGFSSAGWNWNTYTISYIIHGGQNPDLTSTFVASEAQIIEGSLVCVNPGGDFDVRQGKGGITIFATSQLTSDQLNENGKFVVEQLVCGTVADCGLDDFQQTWGVDETHCRNNNWSPDQLLVTSLFLYGQILTDCDPNYPPNEATCVQAKDTAVYCETDEDPRLPWPGNDDEVRYICVDVGSPVAWDDTYSVSVSKTLKVRAPGVLGNDTDAEGDLLTAHLVEGVASGSLVLNTDGSFTYIPVSVGEFSFKYEVMDNLGNIGNTATVTITVY